MVIPGWSHARRSVLTDTITTIGCDACALGPSAACDDCIVTFLTAPPLGGVRVIDFGRRRADRAVRASHPYQRRRS